MADKIKIENKFFIAPNLMFEIGLGKNELLVYMYLIRCANNSTAYPSYETIGRKTGTSRSTAVRAVESLIQKGLIVKHERKEKHIKKDGNVVALNESNIYEVVIELDNFVKEVVSEGHHPSVTGKPPLVSEGHHPSVTQTPPLVSGGHPINNSYINNSYKELFINKILSSGNKNEDENQKPSLVESDDSTKISDDFKKVLNDFVKKGSLTKFQSEIIINTFEDIETLDLLIEQEVITKNQGKSLKTAFNKLGQEEFVFSPDSIELRASKYLFEKMKENNPNAKAPDFQKWANNIKLMIEKDKRDPKVIAKVIEFSQQDEFWKTVLLSTGSLRENFEKLYMQMTTKQNPKDNKKSELDKMKNVYEMAKKLDEEKKRRNA